MASNNECLNSLWDSVSQFVCYEFCRHAHRIFNKSPKGCKMDLISFFRDMVIEMTMKHDDADITKSEILAKFIEELNHSVASKNFDATLQYVPTLKSVFPEVANGIDDLMSNIEEKYAESNSGTDDEVENVIRKMISEFSTHAFQLLPSPDLLKVYQRWENNSKPIVDVETVKERLLQERASLEENRAKILRLINTENVYKQCLNGANADLTSDDDDDDDNYLDPMAPENDSNDSSATTVRDRDSSSNLSSVFEDCESDIEDNRNTSKPETRCRLEVQEKLPLQSEDTSIFYSCPDEENMKAACLSECHVILEDLAKSEDPEIQSVLQSTGCLTKPKRMRIKEESLSSNSEEDFIGSPPKKFFRGWQKGSSKVTSPKGRELPRRRKSLRRSTPKIRKIICHFCRKSFRSAISLQTHDCSCSE